MYIASPLVHFLLDLILNLEHVTSAVVQEPIYSNNQEFQFTNVILCMLEVRVFTPELRKRDVKCCIIIMLAFSELFIKIGS